MATKEIVCSRSLAHLSYAADMSRVKRIRIIDTKTHSELIACVCYKTIINNITSNTTKSKVLVFDKSTRYIRILDALPLETVKSKIQITGCVIFAYNSLKTVRWWASYQNFSSCVCYLLPNKLNVRRRLTIQRRFLSPNFYTNVALWFWTQCIWSQYQAMCLNIPSKNCAWN